MRPGSGTAAIPGRCEGSARARSVGSIDETRSEGGSKIALDGAQPEQPGIEPAGITDIIDCAIEDTGDVPLLASHPNITVLMNGTADDGQPKPPEWFGKGIEFAITALAQPNRKVFAHCIGGANRGPSMTYAIFRALGFSPQLTLNWIHTARPVLMQGGIRYAADADAAVQALGYA